MFCRPGTPTCGFQGGFRPLCEVLFESQRGAKTHQTNIVTLRCTCTHRWLEPPPLVLGDISLCHASPPGRCAGVASSCEHGRTRHHPRGGQRRRHGLNPGAARATRVGGRPRDDPVASCPDPLLFFSTWSVSIVDPNSGQLVQTCAARCLPCRPLATRVLGAPAHAHACMLIVGTHSPRDAAGASLRRR